MTQFPAATSNTNSIPLATASHMSSSPTKPAVGAAANPSLLNRRLTFQHNATTSSSSSRRLQHHNNNRTSTVVACASSSTARPPLGGGGSRLLLKPHLGSSYLTNPLYSRSSFTTTSNKNNTNKKQSMSAVISAAEHPSTSAAAASSAPVHASGSYIPVKVIGVGARGVSALQKIASAQEFAGQAEMWCLDVDAGALESVAGIAGTVLVAKEGTGGMPNEQGPLSFEEVQEIVGRGASDAGGRGNVGSATDGGIAFVLAPASSVPGGPDLVLQLVSALRAAGHFTVVAVTRPFGFEGGAKSESASALISALQSCAHLVAVTEQEVLMQAFGDSQLTVSEATDIADGALEHTARCVLQAVKAHELLKSSKGGLMWHGRDLRHYKRLLSPPLQALLMSPGTAVLGRGQASLPATAAHEMGASQALMELASDAVIAASESPFLDGALETATAVLCCVKLPAAGQRFGPLGALLPADEDDAKRLTRAAAQAAAGALRSITGRGCDDFVLSVESMPVLPADQAAAVSSSGAVRVEASLLVLRAPAPGEAPIKKPALVGGIPNRAYFQPPPAARNNNTNATTTTAGGGQAAAGQQQQKQNRSLPSSTWGMMSAMAGGGGKGAAAAPTAPGNNTKPQQNQQQQPSTTQPKRGLFGAPLKPPTEKPRPVPVVKPTAAERAQSKPVTPKPPPLTRTPTTSAASGNTLTPPPPPSSSSSPPSPSSSSPPSPQQQQRVPQQQQPKSPPQTTISSSAATTTTTSSPPSPGSVTVGDYLAESLTAQSLDLPPVAARWRQQQRSEKESKRRLIVWEAEGIDTESDEDSDEEEYYDDDVDVQGDDDDSDEYEEEEKVKSSKGGGGGFVGLFGGGGKKKEKKKKKEVNLKDRMSSILARDRDEI